MRVFLFLLISFQASAVNLSCSSFLRISIHRLHTLESLAHRAPGFFELETESERRILLDDVHAVLSAGASVLKQPHAHDPYSEQLERTLAAWENSRLLNTLESGIKNLKADGSPYTPLARAMVERVVRLKVLIQSFDVTSPTRLNLQIGDALTELEFLRRELDLKNDDLERVNRALERIDRFDFAALEQNAPTQLSERIERLKIYAWYLRNRGLHSVN